MSRIKPLRVPVEALIEGELTLEGDAANYVLRVHRTPIGHALELFDPLQAVEASAVLVRAIGKNAVCRVGPIRLAEAVPAHDITLVQAWAKGEKVDQIIRDATALGVSEIVVVTAKRSVPRSSADESAERQSRWRRIAIQAARQCGRGNIPRVFGPLGLDQGIAQVASRSLRLLLSPAASTTLATVLRRHAVQPLAVFVGPEGGTDPDEERQLLDAGFGSVRFGNFTLRSETAATAVLGALLDWGAE